MDTFKGTVIHGDGYARTIGWPTANLEDISGDLPKKGTYLIHTRVDEKDYFGGLCIDEKIEVFLLEFEGSLYGKRLSIDVLRLIKEDALEDDRLEALKKGLKMLDEFKASFS